MSPVPGPGGVPSAPIPGPGEYDDEGFLDARWAWATGVVARWNARYPFHEPFDLARFDRCTLVADVCWHCCLIHDLGCFFDLPRAKVDRDFRLCIVAIGREEDRFGWWWTATGWLYWAGVRSWSIGGEVVWRIRARVTTRWPSIGAGSDGR